MTVVNRKDPRVETTTPRPSLAQLVDGKVTFGGYHANLPKARPDSMATLLANTRPPFSAAATQVKHHSNGVTSYNITPLGPPFAYRVGGVSHFELPLANGKTARLSVVEVNIGPDKQTGAKSVYEGRAYQVFGEGPKGPFVAELWDNVKAENGLWDIAAGIHNPIVDGGILGKRGFRGLANNALEHERHHGGQPPQATHGKPSVSVDQALLDFVADPRSIPGITSEVRAALLDALKAQAAAPAAVPSTPADAARRLQTFSDMGRAPTALDSGARPAGTVNALEARYPAKPQA